MGLTVEIGCKPISNLSSGETEMANIARLLDFEQRELDIEGNSKRINIFVDEFTSSLDRSTARKLVAKVYQYIRENYSARRRNFVFVTCHTDVLCFAEPDWVYDTTRCVFRRQGQCAITDYTNGFQNSGYLQIEGYSETNNKEIHVQCIPTPELKLDVELCEPWMWYVKTYLTCMNGFDSCTAIPITLFNCSAYRSLFRDHHYKTRSLSKNARTFIARWNGVPVGFVATIKQVGKNHRSEKAPKPEKIDNYSDIQMHTERCQLAANRSPAPGDGAEAHSENLTSLKRKTRASSSVSKKYKMMSR